MNMRWRDNPDHHIWNNNGTYWIKWVPYDPVVKLPKITAPLKTKDIEEARRRRDELMANWSRKEAA
jgi:hypothetical protein